MAGPLYAADSPAPVKVVIHDGTPRIIEVEARKAPLAQVLDALAAKAGAVVHHSILPMQEVTATCAGETVQRVLRCLLGPGVDLVSQQPAAGRAEASEWWVQGSSLARHEDTDGSCKPTADADQADESDSAPGAGKHKRTAAKKRKDPTPKLLEMAGASDAGQRANAVSRLALEGRGDEQTVRTALEGALSDTDPQVRAQAVYALATREGADATPYLREALHDSDPDVRLMAIDSIKPEPRNLSLLQEAVGDADETVSALAASKLSEISQSGAAE
ncbi:MAG: HEAT repeat domain-containing protein [Methylotetracoccus sp.]